MTQKSVVLDGNSYRIEKIGEGLLSVLAEVEEHGGVACYQEFDDLSWSLLEKTMGWTRPYSSKIDNISESALLKDGSILMCWTVSTWEGTFASHDSIEVGYYLLRKV